jgi:formylglycine-generating enzyme required for sulfatase activity
VLPERLHWVTEGFEPEGDPWVLLTIGEELEAEGNLQGAATVYDRAFGIDPTSEKIRERRRTVLDLLAVVEHGIVFRYVPSGPFLMGSPDGPEDERPRHPVWLSAFWLSETPISWADHARLMGWPAPPHSWPADLPRNDLFFLSEACKLRRQYCGEPAGSPAAQQRPWGPRHGEEAAWRWDTKPMVAVGWQEAEDLAGRLAAPPGVSYGLPSEAQWEKAARGGLIGCRYAWGDEPPGDENCDFDHFHEFVIRPTRALPANGYGLHAMCGGVWEWTRDWYDSDHYRSATSHDPAGPEKGEEKVLRGGSWADCAEVVTVTFRMSRSSRNWRTDERGFGGQMTPNVGFRLCRSAAPA